MGKLKSFFSSLIGVAKAHPILLVLFLIVLVVFGGGVFFAAYRAFRGQVTKIVPQAAAVLPAK